MSRFTSWWFLVLAACLAAVSVQAAPSPSPISRELAALGPIQKRELFDGLVYAKAVNDELVARGDAPLTERDAEFLFELHVANQRKRSNPNGSYGPTKVSNANCPPAPSNQTGGGIGYIRNATSQEINAQEADYIQRHRSAKQDSWRTWLSSASPGPNLNSISGGIQNYTNTISNLPRVGIAVSGGGYRAMMYGAGVVQGWDSRNSTANDRGVGGILQRADYFAGLSGGSWLTGSLAINNWPTTQALNDEVYDLSNNLVIPSDGTVSFYADLISDVKDKRDEGFPTAITDYWGRALSYHLLNDTMYPNHGQATTWSDIVNVTNFQDAAYPFPVVIADQREPGEILIYQNGSIYEFTPYEFGTWNRLKAFIPIQVLGSNISNGNMQQCVEGYDNFGWTVGTSSTLFNGLFTSLIQSDGSSLIKDAILKVAGAVASQDNDISQVPNPFQNFENGQNSANDNHTDNTAQAQYISLVDGGEDNANIPLQPLLQPARQLDFILALDASADTGTSWPNGSSLHQQHLRATTTSDLFNEVPVPYFPPINTFVNRGLNTRPVFFGCNASNASNADTAAHGQPAPIVAYIPNYPYTSLTNFSTFKLDYSPAESQSMLDNGVELASLGGNNATWSQCLACGMLQRSFERSGVPRPSECDACMDTYCWDGVEDNSEPANPYSPPVGKPQWVANTQEQQTPPYTGGGGSSASTKDNAASAGQAVSAVAVVGAAMLAVLGAMTA